MSDNWGTYNGLRVVAGKVTIPYSATWAAVLELSTEDALAVGTTASLVIGAGSDAPLSLVGTVLRSVQSSGLRKVLLAGGYGGWAQTVPAYPYSVSTGIALSLVVKDVAAAVGEKVRVASDVTIGVKYLRQNKLASQVLRHLVGSAWYVDVDGTTVVNATRPVSAITSDFIVERYLIDHQYVVATESPADWLPGRTASAPQIDGTVSVSSVTHTFDNNGTHRTTCFIGPSTYDRMAAPLRAIVYGELERLAYLGRWEYVVQASNGTTIDATPSPFASAAAPIELPECTGLLITPSPAGENVTMAVGAICHVTFVNGDPTKPVVVGGDYSTAPTQIKFAGGGPAVARVGDTTISAYEVLTGAGALDSLYSGTTAGHAAAVARAAVLGGGAIVVELDGAITSGSGVVQSG